MQNMSGGKSALGLDANVTALIGYIIGIVALILLFIEKDNKFVRFHAVQSLLYHLLAAVVFILFGIFTTILAFISGILATLVSLIVGLIWIAMIAGLIFLAYKAFQGETFKFPVIGDLSDKWSS